MILFTHDFKKEMQKLNGVTACMLQSPNFCLDTVGGSDQIPQWTKSGKIEQSVHIIRTLLYRYLL